MLKQVQHDHRVLFSMPMEGWLLKQRMTGEMINM
jgi:hypothetical protein